MNTEDFYEDWTEEEYANASLMLFDAYEVLGKEGVPDPMTPLLYLRQQRGSVDFNKWANRLANATSRAIAAHNHTNRATPPPF